jgi:hypothetical protein
MAQTKEHVCIAAAENEIKKGVKMLVIYQLSQCTTTERL